jgi:hypothetical protein
MVLSPPQDIARPVCFSPLAQEETCNGLGTFAGTVAACHLCA